MIDQIGHHTDVAESPLIESKAATYLAIPVAESWQKSKKESRNANSLDHPINYLSTAVDEVDLIIQAI